MSDSKKWTAMMSRKPELDLGGQARKIENQRVQIKRLTEKNANMCRMLDDMEAQIAALEAEVARLREASKRFETDPFQLLDEIAREAIAEQLRGPTTEGDTP